jgi:hypothetical protein
MRKPLFHLMAAGVILGTLVLGSGCTSVKLKSTKDPAAVRKINRLFVLINQGETDNAKLSNQLIEHFRNALSNSPVQVEFSIASPLDLDEKVHDSKIKQFDAEGVLSVSVTTFILSEYGGYPTIIYDVSLFDPELKKRLWRGSVNNSGGTALMNRRMREMAEAIVSQLKKDGFL